jgi:hypothetical protein
MLFNEFAILRCSALKNRRRMNEMCCNFMFSREWEVSSVKYSFKKCFSVDEPIEDALLTPDLRLTPPPQLTPQKAAGASTKRIAHTATTGTGQPKPPKSYHWLL